MNQKKAKLIRRFAKEMGWSYKRLKKIYKMSDKNKRIKLTTEINERLNQ